MAKPTAKTAPDLGASDVTDVATSAPANELPDFLVPYLTDLSTTGIAELVRTSSWDYPTLETVHVIGLGLLFGGIFLLDLRLLGLNKSISVANLSRHVLPWVWIGFAVNLTSGAMLFASDPLSLAANISFQLKMLLLVVAAFNAAVFQFNTARDMPRWDESTSAPTSAKLAAVISISVWLSIITLGRLIAYWA
jgi:Family of unknown function (DUF6644)